MKKSFLTLAVLAASAIALYSCEKGAEHIDIDGTAPVEFYAETSREQTKTVTEDGQSVLWQEGDKVSILRGEDINDEYIVKEGFGGKTTTKLVRVEDGSFAAGSETVFDANIAYYPFGHIAYCGANGNHSLSVAIPDVQKYAVGSFGKGAFPMVAVSADKTDNKLPFKNLFGAIRLRFRSPECYYGIKEITVKGNNGEALSGDAIVACSHADAPVVTFDPRSAKDYVKLDCAECAGLVPGEVVDFWIALPPVVFQNGITVTVAFGNGETLERKTTAPLAIVRSMVTPMEVVKVDSEMGELYIPDAGFKGWLLGSGNVDMDGDGILTLKDAKAWNEQYAGKDVQFKIDVQSISGIGSLKGIEYFTALTALECTWRYRITELDLSRNTALKEVNCFGLFDLESLNLGDNKVLKVLNCSSTKLGTLDIGRYTTLETLRCDQCNLKELNVSRNTALKGLYCEENQLGALDVSRNTALQTLSCSDNRLSVLDIGKNTALSHLYCASNQLSVLDISKNTALTEVNCNNNKISSLILGDKPALEELRCKNNQLTELNLDKCRALYLFDCGGNQLTMLDVSKTDLGGGRTSMPMSCRMESLATLYLKTGWEIPYINVNRYVSFIHPNTTILYKD